tara:strand:+ start:847 stop:1071 length:225 start_codon:yes stop_codon:yes gene_type:complete
MYKVGVVALLIGVAILASYWVIAVMSAVFFEDEVPILIKIAIPAVFVGSALLFITTIRDRMRDKKKENFKEVKY